MKREGHIIEFMKSRIDISSRACHSGGNQQLRFINEVNRHRPRHQTAANLPAQPTTYSRKFVLPVKWMFNDKSESAKQSSLSLLSIARQHHRERCIHYRMAG